MNGQHKSQSQDETASVAGASGFILPAPTALTNAGEHLLVEALPISTGCEQKEKR
jgi:hypothetical protein